MKRLTKFIFIGWAFANFQGMTMETNQLSKEEIRQRIGDIITAPLKEKIFYTFPNHYERLLSDTQKVITLLETCKKQDCVTLKDNGFFSWLKGVYQINDPTHNQLLKKLSGLLPIEVQEALLKNIFNYRLSAGFFQNQKGEFIFKENNQLVFWKDYLENKTFKNLFLKEAKKIYEEKNLNRALGKELDTQFEKDWNTNYLPLVFFFQNLRRFVQEYHSGSSYNQQHQYSGAPFADFFSPKDQTTTGMKNFLEISPRFDLFIKQYNLIGPKGSLVTPELEQAYKQYLNKLFKEALENLGFDGNNQILQNTLSSLNLFQVKDAKLDIMASALAHRDLFLKLSPEERVKIIGEYCLQRIEDLKLEVQSWRAQGNWKKAAQKVLPHHTKPLKERKLVPSVGQRLSDIFAQNEKEKVDYTKPQFYNTLKNNTERLLAVLEFCKNKGQQCLTPQDPLVEKIADLYALSDPEHNQRLNHLTTLLTPEVQTALIPNLLKKRLPDGFLKDENGKLILGDHLHRFVDSPAKGGAYEELHPKNIQVIRNDPLLTNPLGVNEAEGAFLKTSENDPVGYTIFTNKQAKEAPKALVIRVYGGSEKGDKDTFLDYASNPNKGPKASQFMHVLLNQNIAVVQLNLVDLHENTKFQSYMEEPIFKRVLKGIHTFIEAVQKGEVDPSLESLKQVPIFLIGESFGGLTVARFLQEYPNTVTGGISWNGALNVPLEGKETIKEYLDPMNYLVNSEKTAPTLKDPFLVMASAHDNKVLLDEALSFKNSANKIAEQFKQKQPVHLFVTKRANRDTIGNEASTYTGHFLPKREDLVPVMDQILHFIHQSSLPIEARFDATKGGRVLPLQKKLGVWWQERYTQYGALTNLNALDPNKLFMAEARKVYEKNLSQLKARGDFETQFEHDWNTHYLPLLLFMPDLITRVEDQTTDWVKLDKAVETYNNSNRLNPLQFTPDSLDDFSKDMRRGQLAMFEKANDYLSGLIAEKLAHLGFSINEPMIKALIESDDVISIARFESQDLLNGFATALALRDRFLTLSEKELSKAFGEKMITKMQTLKASLKKEMKQWHDSTKTLWKETSRQASHHRKLN